MPSVGRFRQTIAAPSRCPRKCPPQDCTPKLLPGDGPSWTVTPMARNSTMNTASSRWPRVRTGATFARRTGVALPRPVVPQGAQTARPDLACANRGVAARWLPVPFAPLDDLRNRTMLTLRQAGHDYAAHRLLLPTAVYCCGRCLLLRRLLETGRGKMRRHQFR